MIGSRKKIIHKIKGSEGFTLVEMIVSMAIFSMVSVAMMGALTLAIRAQEFATIEKTMSENTRFSLEFMSRQLRFAQRYDGFVSQPAGCIPLGDSFDSPSAQQIILINSENKCIRFVLSANTIFFEDLTDPLAIESTPLTQISQVKIDNLEFIVSGETSVLPDREQPRVTIVIQASMSALSGPSSFHSVEQNVQTTVTQRHLDTPI